MLISAEDLNQIAAQSYEKLKTEAAIQGALNQDQPLLQRVAAISKRLETETSTFRSDAPDWKWEVNVIGSDQVNAFCMPGGKIAVFTGLATQLPLTDDELAIVLGHEISHALREHSREQVSQALAAQSVIGIGRAIFGLGHGSAQAAAIAYSTLIASRFSRTDESEADRIGLELTARAGYDPHAGITLWEKMLKASNGAHPPVFLSSHPSDANRIKTIQSLLPAVTPLYQAAKRRQGPSLAATGSLTR